MFYLSQIVLSSLNQLNYILLYLATGPNRFKARASSNVLLVMAAPLSSGNTSREPAVALVSPAGSSAPPQPATEPDTSTANSKPHTLENSKLIILNQIF